MNLEHLLQAAPSVNKEETKPVSPTLMIGLGGTGKEVLLRFRRRAVERYGSLNAMPFVRFLHVDTDTTASSKEQVDLPSSNDPLDEAVRFRPSERIDLTIEGGTGKYVQHIRTYPHIKRWFPTTGKIADLGNLGDGAGQVRVASRLGFYHAPNFQKITSALDHARRNLNDPKILTRVSSMGFEFDGTKTDAFVICSIAGGTGGGTFLDMGFLLNRYFDNLTSAGILLLPSFFAGYAGGTRVRANGYAALMELNHHAFGNVFVANWDGSRNQLLPPPPFGITYLVDGTNEASLGIPSNGGETDAYQMIADVLFQDYSLGSFAGKKRATRVNLANFSQEVYSHNFLNEALRNRSASHQRHVVGDTFPTRFGSFGFSAIEFPADRVHSACGARLATEILHFWQNTLLDDPLEDLFTRFLTHTSVQFAQGRIDRRDGGGTVQRSDIEQSLGVYEEGGGRTFDSFLWERAQKIRHRIEATPVSQKAATLETELAELDRILAFEDSGDPEEWGLGIRQLESNKRHYLDRVREGIGQRAQELANDPRYGVAYTLSLLRELKSLLRNSNFQYLGHFEAAIVTWRDEIQNQSYDLDQLKLDLARHEREFFFRGHHLKWDLEQLVGSREGAEPGAIYGYYWSRVMKQIAKRGKAICEAIDEFLGKDDVTGDGLLASYWRLLSSFGQLQERLRRKATYFRAEQRSELRVSLYRDEDTDTWYRQWVGQDAQLRQTLETVGNQLLKDVFEVDTVTAAMARIQRTSATQLEESLLARCKQFFAGQEKQPEALKMLFDKRWDGERQRMVKRAYDLAKVWLKPAGSGLDHINLRPVIHDQRPCLIGVDMGDNQRFPEFERLLGEIRSSDDSPSSFQEIGRPNRHMILFYNELAGVPAFYSEAITRPGGLRDAYSSWDEKEDLHFDKNRFQFGDLIPKTTEEAREFADSVRAFVLARILGLLKVRELRDEESDQTTLYFSYARGGSLDAEDVSLGTEEQAIDALYRDPRPAHQTDRFYLLDAAEKTLESLRAENLLWVYWLLLDFYLYMVYPPSRDDQWVSNLTVVQYRPEHAVLAGARDQIRTMLPSDDAGHQLEKALEAARRGKQGEEMTYEDYMAALASHVQLVGRFEVTKRNLVVDRSSFLATPVLDRQKLLGPVKTWPDPAPVSQSPSKEQRVRACPNCRESIPIRATFCTHCKQKIAVNEPCPHCNEAVPNDLESCWNCGNHLRRGNWIDCPECHAWSGYEDELPCPECGHDPRRATSPTDDGPSVSSGGAAGATPKPSDDGFEMPPTPAPVADSEEAPSSVECPTCYTLVAAGPRCSECDGLL